MYDTPMARNNKPYDARATAIDIGVHLNDEQIRRLQEIARDYDASDWRMWTKNRLSEWGLLRAARVAGDSAPMRTIGLEIPAPGCSA